MNMKKITTLQKQFEVFRMNLGGKYLLMAADQSLYPWGHSDIAMCPVICIGLNQSPTYLMVYSGYLCDLLKYTVRKL